MKKKIGILFSLILVTSFAFSATHFVESFENPDAWSGYTTGTVTFDSGAWDFISVYPEGSGDSYDGSKACRINDDVAGASITAPAVNTVGTVSFYYHRPYSGSGTFDFQISVDGGAYTTLASVDYSDITSPTYYSYDVNNAGNNIRVRIQNDDHTAHLTIDYVTVNDYDAGSNSAPSIIQIETDPSYPGSSDTVNVTANITDSDGSITSASLFWGTVSGSLTNEITMSETATTDVYQTDSVIPDHSEGTVIYYEIQATDDEPETTTSPEKDYTVATDVTIYDIQYTVDPSGDSPYLDQVVSTDGIVTAIMGNYFVIQDATGAWNGIWINSSEIVSTGDNITVNGPVVENYDNTEINNPYVSVNSSGNPLPSVTSISTADVNSENYEGVLISVSNAECTSTPNTYGEWEIDDGVVRTPCVVDDLGYVFDPTLGNFYDVTGPVIYSYGDFKVEPRDATDIVQQGDTNPPTISSISVIDENTIEVNFSEDVEEITAETTTNYTIADRVVTVTGAVLDGVNATHVTLTVSGMIYGDYTLLAVGVEDLSANPSNDSENFSYTEPFTGDIIINEVDADQTGTDTGEFIELYDGGVGNTVLDGLVVVLFNGSDDQSYNDAIDLDGYTTDVNGYFVIGSSTVPNVDLVAFVENGIQNGADAVALYLGNATDFPNDTPITTDNLIDAIVYDTSDGDDAALLVLLNSGQPQVDENGNGLKDTESNQRIPNGSGGARNTDTYAQAIPTPGAENQAGTLDAPTNVQISHDGTNVSITWDTVTGANSYYIYEGSVPDVDTTPGSHIEQTGLNSYSETVFSAMKFYKITSSADMPPE
ncbi:MAG: hypothetical protein K8S23_05445 [Candidatus Cloacimonetes bacterium]|nr:hypothetical protein [Candidatus Cloacimonadota bacterium]